MTIPNILNLQIKKHFFRVLRRLKLRHTFPSLRQISLENNKDLYVLEKIRSDNSNIEDVFKDDFILRKANKNLKRVYSIKQSDRFKIIKTIKNLMQEEGSFYVCKLDITSFYESIDKNKILKDLHASSILSYETKCVIKNILEHEKVKTNGLPRGINISATLSEYYMKDFDRKIKKKNGIYFYARYVDDIFLLSTNNIQKSDIDNFQEILPKGLRFNMNKVLVAQINKDSNREFFFLGYKFKRVYYKGLKKPILKIGISPKKIKNIKSKIMKAFLEFSNTKDFNLLRQRLFFLSANYPMKRKKIKMSPYEKAGFLHGGIAFNYPLINDLSCLKDLDTFLYKILKTKTFKKINSVLVSSQIDLLKKYSFYEGYRRRITRKFTLSSMAEITRCWRRKF